MKKRTADYDAGIKDTIRTMRTFFLMAGPEFSMVVQRPDGKHAEYSVTLNTVKPRPKLAKIIVPQPEGEPFKSDELKITFV